MLCLVTQLCPTLCDPMDCNPPGFSVLGDFLGKNTGVGCHALLQEVFPTQGLNPGLWHCRQILYRLSHQGSPSQCIGKHLSTSSGLWRGARRRDSNGSAAGLQICSCFLNYHRRQKQQNQKALTEGEGRTGRIRLHSASRGLRAITHPRAEGSPPSIPRC